MHIHQRQHAAISHRQLAQGRLQQRVLLRTFQRLRWARLFASLTGYFVVLNLALRWRGLQGVASQIAGDRKQPCAKLRTLVLEAVQMRPGTQKSLLGNVFRLSLSHSHAAQKAEQRAFIQVDQLGKSLLLASRDTPQDGLYGQSPPLMTLARRCDLRAFLFSCWRGRFSISPDLSKADGTVCSLYRSGGKRLHRGQKI